MYFIIPLFILSAFLFSFFKKNDSYQSFINGAKEGMHMAIKIFPLVLAMVFATSIFNISNFLQDILSLLDIDVPALILMQGLFRPLSNNASLAFMLEIYQVFGVDSKIAIASSVLEGSSDTTIYIISLYFGSVGIIKYRYALLVGLIADFIGFIITILTLYYI